MVKTKMKHSSNVEEIIYGNRQAAENWFDMLKTGLEDEGFKQNKLDPCIL